jgi:hypothetical protein
MITKKRILEIKDVPYVYLDSSLIEGELDDVAFRIKDLKRQLKEAHEMREAARSDENFTPFSLYEKIRLERDYFADTFELQIRVFREETEDEEKERIKKEKDRDALIKSREEKKERALYEKLKKKFEK